MLKHKNILIINFQMKARICICLFLLTFACLAQASEPEEKTFIEKERQKKMRQDCAKRCFYSRDPKCQTLCYQAQMSSTVAWNMFLIFGLPPLVLICLICCLICFKRSLKLKKLLNVVDSRGDVKAFYKGCQKIITLLRQKQFLYRMSQGSYIKSKFKLLQAELVKGETLLYQVKIKGVDTIENQPYAWSSKGYVLMKGQQLHFWMHKCFQDQLNHEIFVLSNMNRQHMEGKCDSFKSFDEYNENLRFDWYSGDKEMRQEDIQISLQQTSAQLIQK